MTGREHRAATGADSTTPGWWSDNHERVINFAYRLAAGCVPPAEAENLAFAAVVEHYRTGQADPVDLPSSCRAVAAHLDTALADRTTRETWSTALTRAAYQDALHDMSPVQQQVVDLLMIRQQPCRDVAATTGLSVTMIFRQAHRLVDEITSRTP